jgi:hypothetical protein
VNQRFRIFIRSFLDDDVLIGFLVDWLPAMFAKDHFGHRNITPSAGSELDGEAQCTIFFSQDFTSDQIGRRNFTEP